MVRKQKTFHYIYKTTCLITNKYYIGMHSTNNLEDGYLGSGRRLKYSIMKYGKENHSKEILEFHENREELKKREHEIINKELIINDKFCINLCIGGNGGRVAGFKQSNETKEKIKLALIGSKLTDERKRKISISGKGKHFRKFSEEHKQKLSKSKRGIPSKLRGIPRSNETKTKISISNKGKNTSSRNPLSNETKIKISQGVKGKNSLKVVQLDKNDKLIKIWDSILEAKETLKINHINKVCKGQRKTAGGFKWKYLLCNT